MNEPLAAARPRIGHAWPMAPGLPMPREHAETASIARLKKMA